MLDLDARRREDLGEFGRHVRVVARLLDPWLATHAGDDYTNCECPRCGEELLHTSKEVIDEHGNRQVHMSEATDTAACYCPECWKERRTIERQRESTSLTDFAVKVDNRTLDEFDPEASK